MAHNKTPWTDQLSVNQASPTASVAIVEEAADQGGAVASVFGRTGDVIAQAGDYTATQVGLGNVTNDAQLKRAAADFSSFANKATPVGADVLLIEDSAAAGAKKNVLVSDLVGAGALSYLEQDFPGVAQPGSPTVPTIHTFVHNQNKYPKTVDVYFLRASGEWAVMDGFFSPTVGTGANWSNAVQYTGVPNTLNQYSVALFSINDGTIPNPTTLKLRLGFE